MEGADLRERFQWCQFSPHKTEYNGAPDLESYEGCNQLENHHSLYEVEEQEVYKVRANCSKLCMQIGSQKIFCKEKLPYFFHAMAVLFTFTSLFFWPVIVLCNELEFQVIRGCNLGHEQNS